MEQLGKTNEVRELPKDFQERQASHWDLRYGGKERDKKRWMFMAFGVVAICIILAIGYVKQVSEGKYIPFMVTDGEHGSAVAVRPASRINSVPKRMVGKTLSRAIYCFRTVSIDKRVLQLNISELYSYLNETDPAYNKLTQHLSKKKNDPYKRAIKVVTSIDFTSVMQMASGEWIIKWQENTFTRKGKLIPSQSGRYQAIINTIIVPASITNEKDMDLLNPLGIYIRDITWQKELN